MNETRQEEMKVAQNVRCILHCISGVCSGRAVCALTSSSCPSWRPSCPCLCPCRPRPHRRARASCAPSPSACGSRTSSARQAKHCVVVIVVHPRLNGTGSVPASTRLSTQTSAAWRLLAILCIDCIPVLYGLPS